MTWNMKIHVRYEKKRGKPISLLVDSLCLLLRTKMMVCLQLWTVIPKDKAHAESESTNIEGNLWQIQKFINSNTGHDPVQDPRRSNGLKPSLDTIHSRACSLLIGSCQLWPDNQQWRQNVVLAIILYEFHLLVVSCWHHHAHAHYTWMVTCNTHTLLED